MIVQLPHKWKPRGYQMPAWSYLEKGGRHAELIWHRRAGKDEICLHRAAQAAFERPATYWHMLPMASQARKAIWDAINPHTGKRRIDEAFPMVLRATTRENEMMIRFRNGSTWQVVGSDNFNSLVGSPPVGITASEWALANPAARAYLRPILLENNGWQLYITTPRGKNHAWSTFTAAQRAQAQGRDVFAQCLSAYDTGAMSREALDEERQNYIDDYGEEAGDSLFRQEFLCDWDAALLGTFFGKEMRQALDGGRICDIEYDPAVPVETAWDLGHSDDTAIWFFQRVRGEKRFIDYYSASGQDIVHFAEQLQKRSYKYGDHWLPHDARAKTLASNGKSVVEQLLALGIRGQIVPNLSLQDGIQAARMVFPACWFDETKCATGIEALRQYRRAWDQEKKIFMPRPLHDWASHGADAFRYAAIAMRDGDARPKSKDKPRFLDEMTLDELWSQTTGRSQRI